MHPYHHEIIGDMADLYTIQRNDLYHHYQTYYAPENAVLAVAGDFETGSMLAEIKQLYESIPTRGAPRAFLAQNLPS